MQALRHLGPDTHVLAVCQPAPLVLAAVSVLAAAGDPAQPRSLTLIAGPIDTRVNPNRINTMAERRPLSFYERFLTTRVPGAVPRRRPAGLPGGRPADGVHVAEPRRHLSAHVELYRALVAGDEATAARIRDFYDEYGAVMDVPAEFYLETLQRIFMEHDLPRGEFTWRGEQVDPSAIRETALLTVEGAQDDMCSPGQTEAAHGLCTSIPPERKRHHLQEGVGHYGVFAGSRWESEIYPVIRAFIAEHRAGAGSLGLLTAGARQGSRPAGASAVALSDRKDATTSAMAPGRSRKNRCPPPGLRGAGASGMRHAIIRALTGGMIRSSSSARTSVGCRRVWSHGRLLHPLTAYSCSR